MYRGHSLLFEKKTTNGLHESAPLTFDSYIYDIIALNKNNNKTKTKQKLKDHIMIKYVYTIGIFSDNFLILGKQLIIYQNQRLAFIDE